MKVVINACYGGFGLSHEAIMRYAEIKGLTLYPETDRRFPNYWLVPEGERPAPQDNWHELTSEERKASNEAHHKATLNVGEIPRDDAALVQVVEEMGDEASGDYARLQVCVIPDDVKWQIKQYDGFEWVAGRHRTWGAR